MATFTGNFNLLFPNGVPRPGMTTAQQPNFGVPKPANVPAPKPPTAMPSAMGVPPQASVPKPMAPSAPTNQPGMNAKPTNLIYYPGMNNTPNKLPGAPNVPAPNNYSAAAPKAPVPMPQPKRWNPDATPEQQIAHFRDPNNLQDTQGDLLEIKNVYAKEMAAGASPERLAQIHNWATDVRNAAGIRQDHKIYGNGDWIEETPTDAPAMTAAPTMSSPTFDPSTIPQAPQVPVYAPAIKTMDEDAIRKYAQETTARKLSESRMYADQQTRAAKGVADQQLGALGSQFNKLKTTIGEDRSVQNVENARRLSPFSGRSDYAQGMIEQNRARSDREMDQNYQMQQANVTGDLANLQKTIEEKYAAMQNAAPNEAEQIFQSIKNDERNYDLMVHGQLRDDLVTNSQLNNTQFNQALQTYGANRSAFEADRGFGYQQSRDSANDQFRDKQSNWGAYLDTVDRNQNWGDGPKEDYGQLPNSSGPETAQGRTTKLQQEGARLSNEMAKLQLDAYPAEQKLRIQQLQKQIAEIGKTPYQSTSDQRMDELKVEMAQIELENLKNPKPKTTTQTAEDYAKYIDSTPGLTTKNEDTGAETVNKEAVERMILASGLTESEMVKLYQRYGLQMGN